MAATTLACGIPHHGPFRSSHRRIGLDLLAQLEHVGVDRACVEAARVLPDPLQELVAALNATLPLGQVGEQPKLEGREWNGGVTDDHLMAAHMDAHRTRGKEFLLGHPRHPSSAENGIDAKDQLARAERLRNVVVSAQLEPDDAIDFIGALCDDDDRERARPRVFSESSQDLRTRNAFEEDIEQHQ